METNVVRTRNVVMVYKASLDKSVLLEHGFYPDSIQFRYS